MPYIKGETGYKEVAGTSERAARDFRPKQRTIHREILSCLSKASHELSADEIALKIGRDFMAVRPRMTELLNQGLVSKFGRRFSRYANSATGWRITIEGRKHA